MGYKIVMAQALAPVILKIIIYAGAIIIIENI